MPVISHSIVNFVKICYETEVDRVSDEGNYCKGEKHFIFVKETLIWVTFKNMFLLHIKHTGSLYKDQDGNDIYVER